MSTYNIQYFCKDSVDKIRYWDGLNAKNEQDAFFVFHNTMRNTFNLTFKDFRVYDIVEADK